MRKSSSGSTAPSLGTRSRTWPYEARTWKSLPRYLLIVLALAGDSTMSRCLGICGRFPGGPVGRAKIGDSKNTTPGRSRAQETVPSRDGAIYSGITARMVVSSHPSGRDPGQSAGHGRNCDGGHDPEQAQAKQAGADRDHHPGHRAQLPALQVRAVGEGPLVHHQGVAEHVVQRLAALAQAGGQGRDQAADAEAEHDGAEVRGIAAKRAHEAD